MATKPNVLGPDLEHIRHALAVLVEPGSVVELRVPKAGRAGTVSGYFNDLDAAAKAAETWSGKAQGVYFTFNPVTPALLARSSNRMQERAEHTTSDADIERRRWLYVDADAVRPAGICSTDAEHGAALERVGQILDFLVDQGVPPASIVTADSGNGGSLYVRVDLPNDADSLALVKGFLEALHGLFSDRAVSVDRSVGNAARIIRVPGTLNAKGDKTVDRPHRLAHLLAVPDALEICPREVLERIAALAPEPERQARAQGMGRPYSGPSFQFDAWLAASGLKVSKVKPCGTGMLYELESCPWNPEHCGTARIVRFDNGALSAGCFHNSCQGKGWRDLRDVVEGPDRGRHHNMPPGDSAPSSANSPHLIRLADVESEEVRWLWRGYIPYGKVTLLVGDPGLGKSWATLDLAARVTVGGETPDRAHSIERGAVIILTAEDGLADTVRPRVDVQGGDATLVYVLDVIVEADGGERLPSLVEDMAALEQAVVSTSARLVIVDPLNAFTGRIDSHVDAEVRRALTPLAKMAERTRAAIVVVMHLNKATLQTSLYRVQGSIGYVGVARSVLLVVRAREDPSQRILVPTKANLTGEMPGIGFTITQEPALSWLGVVANVDVAALLSPPPRDGDGPSRVEQAIDFLREVLNEGPVKVKAICAEAKEAGIEERTLRRARQVLPINAVRHNEGKRGEGYWTWGLVQDCQGPYLDDGNLEHQEGNTHTDVPGSTGAVQDDQGGHVHDGHLEQERKKVLL